MDTYFRIDKILNKKTLDNYKSIFKDYDKTMHYAFYYEKFLQHQIFKATLRKFLEAYEGIIKYLGWDTFSNEQLDHIANKVLEDLRIEVIKYCDMFDSGEVSIPPITFFSQRDSEGIHRIYQQFGMNLYETLLFIAPLLNIDKNKIEVLTTEKKILEGKGNSPNSVKRGSIIWERNKLIFFLLKKEKRKPAEAYEQAQKIYPLKNTASVKTGYYNFRNNNPVFIGEWQSEISKS